jgi:hypothetical protein
MENNLLNLKYGRCKNKLNSIFIGKINIFFEEKG